MRLGSIAAPTLAFACPDDLLVEFSVTRRVIGAISGAELEVATLTLTLTLDPTLTLALALTLTLDPTLTLALAPTLPLTLTKVVVGKESTHVITGDICAPSTTDFFVERCVSFLKHHRIVNSGHAAHV